ncbi:SixA phosphatase family protein [Agromyces sp. NPDC056965]|uniref:SixA phosphatase family protein n=1 Tax=Agromyces sp. NPDC056965 TaxID=3345983 RepID=UPI003644A620
MKTVLLVRHAKSSWGDPALPDHERPLNHRGRRDAPRAGERLRERGVVPDVIVTSTAVRARSTAAILAQALDLGSDRVVEDGRLYGASPEGLVDIIRALDDELATVMLVGHNPEIGELAFELSDEIAEMPTCAVAEFRYDVSEWTEVGGVAPVGVVFEAPPRDR